MASYSGQIDFTVLCRLWKQHKELFNMVTFKDGEHALLYVTLHERKEPDEKGNTHYLTADCKKDDRKDGVNYYVGSRFKQKDYGNNGETKAAVTTTAVDNEGDLPF